MRLPQIVGQRMSTQLLVVFVFNLNGRFPAFIFIWQASFSACLHVFRGPSCFGRILFLFVLHPPFAYSLTSSSSCTLFLPSEPFGPPSGFVFRPVRSLPFFQPCFRSKCFLVRTFGSFFFSRSFFVSIVPLRLAISMNPRSLISSSEYISARCFL